LLQAFGADLSICDRPPRTGLTVPDQECVQAQAWFDRMNLHHPILLHVGSGSAVDWPLAHMAQLADRLVERGAPVLVSTGFRRPDLEKAMRDTCARPHIFTPTEPRIEQLASWLKLSGCVVAASTGPLHLGGALGTPTVGLFPCIKDCLPAQWGPMGERAINLVVPTPPEGMYRRRHLADPNHMQALAVDTVLEAVVKQISV
jgi:ADP-heptose:LPS heptosyltransferase